MTHEDNEQLKQALAQSVELLLQRGNVTTDLVVDVQNVAKALIAGFALVDAAKSLSTSR